jgi:hypothetical protein
MLPVTVGLVVVVLTFFLFSFRRIIAQRIGLNHQKPLLKRLRNENCFDVTAPFIWLHFYRFFIECLQIKQLTEK